MREATQSLRKSPDIVIYCLNYAPELVGAGRYTSEISRYLISKGHNVMVVAAPPHYPEWLVSSAYFALHYTSEIRNGISIVRCPIFVGSKLLGKLWRLLAPLSFAASSAPVISWVILRHRPKLVFCVEPTLLAAPVALIAAKSVGARTVLHVHDLEVDAAFAVGHLKTDVMKRLALFFERCVLLGFDRIVSISTKMQERLIAKGVRPERINIIRNWADLDQIRPLVNSNPLRLKLGLSEETFVVLCCGSIGAKQALHILLDVAERFAKKKNVTFVIAGDGPAKRSLIERYGHLPNTRFLPLQPENQLCELLNLADLHVITQDRGVADLVLPSKLGGILASGKPLLVTADSGTELFEILRGTAIIVPPGDTDAIAKEISHLTDQRSHPSIGDGRKLAELFSKNVSLPRFYQVIVGMMRGQNY
jgi:colanic acid biosynthesis glycosyl transferase WcaI